MKAGTPSDAGKLAYIREVIADEEQLKNHKHRYRNGEQHAQASAFTKIRRFLYEQEGNPDF